MSIGEHAADITNIERLAAVAGQYDLAVPDENLEKLAAHLHTYPCNDDGWKTLYPSREHRPGNLAGLTVQTHLFLRETPDAQMQFRPAIRGNTKENIMLQGIHSAWDYLLLCESGIIPIPEKIYGTTGFRMARIAHKVGFKALSPQPERIAMSDVAMRVRYESFRDRTFSPQMQRVARRLTSITAKQRISPDLRTSSSLTT